MLLLDALVWFAILYTLLTPVVPWFFARERGKAGAWRSARIALFVLALLHVSLWPACAAAGCGQGAVLLVLLWQAALVSAAATLISAAVAAHVWRQCAPSGSRRPVRRMGLGQGSEKIAARRLAAVCRPLGFVTYCSPNRHGRTPRTRGRVRIAAATSALLSP
jgi:hypothetical protein